MMNLNLIYTVLNQDSSVIIPLKSMIFPGASDDPTTLAFAHAQSYKQYANLFKIATICDGMALVAILNFEKAVGEGNWSEFYGVVETSGVFSAGAIAYIRVDRVDPCTCGRVANRCNIPVDDILKGGPNVRVVRKMDVNLAIDYLTEAIAYFDQKRLVETK